VTASRLRAGLAALVAASAVAPTASLAATATPRTTGLDPAQVRLASGNDHTCELQGDGTVRCWGDNSRGQLGDGTTQQRNSPVSPNLSGAVQITAGAGHTCALIADGTVRCWGDDSAGQVGNGAITATPITTPVQVSGVTNAIHVTAGQAHTCALLADGTASCWGDDSAGQLGNGQSTSQHSTPVAVSGLTGAVEITAGSRHTCALLETGSVRCWGTDHEGEIGDGGALSTNALVPTPVSGLSSAVQVVAGSEHTCALLSGGAMRCWGNDDAGQIGDGFLGVNAETTPVAVKLPTSPLPIALTASTADTCVVMADGTARCWGTNFAGQIGDGTTTVRPTATAVLGLTGAVAVAAGETHTCAVLADESVRCWGDNSKGQLGNGTTSPSKTPTSVAGGGGSVTARLIALGKDFSCAERADSTVACWGNGQGGALGNGTQTAVQTTPVAVLNLRGATALAAGSAHVCTRLATGAADCWGGGLQGQLGNGQHTADALTPVGVSSLAGAVALTGGVSHTCALLASGTVECWGGNFHGPLGDGTQTERDSPAPVSGLTGAIQIAAGGSHTCALVFDGTVRCWGDDTQGELGDGATNTIRLTPVAVVGLSGVASISAGSTHTCATLADGTARCWGDNTSGQLGDGGTTQQPLPDTVIGETAATALAGGDQHSCALGFLGFAGCWGKNSSGQLGNATVTQSPQLVGVKTVASTSRGTTVAFLADITDLGAGSDHSCAVTVGGLVYCWGNNGFGQLGIGSTSNRDTAVSVASFVLNIDPHVKLLRGRHSARVTILATCPAGLALRVTVTLRQGRRSARGTGAFRCAGRLARFPVTVRPGKPRQVLRTAAGIVSAVGLIVHRGHISERQRWSRAVGLHK
jgi:alpha-tubulin suppressor-like RCC1 family protein